MGIGFLELVIIGVVALVLLGPQRMPEIMRQIARFYVQLRRTSNDFKSAFDHVIKEAEQEIRRDELSRLEQSIRNIPETGSSSAPLPANNNVDPPSQDTPPSKDLPSPRPEKPFGWESEGRESKSEVDSKPEI